MSGDEKAQQVGQLVRQLQDAKEELAHLNLKIGSVSRAYKEAGESITKGGDYHIESSHFRLSRVTEINVATLLLNENDLVALLEERNQAWKKVEVLCAELRGLGINASML